MSFHSGSVNNINLMNINIPSFSLPTKTKNHFNLDGHSFFLSNELFNSKFILNTSILKSCHILVGYQKIWQGWSNQGNRGPFTLPLRFWPNYINRSKTKFFQECRQNSKSKHVNGCNDTTRLFEMARNTPV